ncbi:MAG: hypothetical protein FD180_3971, partial [Planctomycetota bacterium]
CGWKRGGSWLRRASLKDILDPGGLLMEGKKENSQANNKRQRTSQAAWSMRRIMKLIARSANRVVGSQMSNGLPRGGFPCTYFSSLILAFGFAFRSFDFAFSGRPRRSLQYRPCTRRSEPLPSPKLPSPRAPALSLHEAFTQFLAHLQSSVGEGKGKGDALVPSSSSRPIPSTFHQSPCTPPPRTPSSAPLPACPLPASTG